MQNDFVSIEKCKILFSIIFFALVSASLAQINQQTRRQPWACKIELEGLPNFHKINDNLYRGAQPDETGMKKLDSLGIKTIINLRSFHSDRDEMEGIPFNYIHIYMKAWHPEEKEVIEFLQVVTDTSNYPIFFHCMHGADRTGLMAAVYRIAVQGWSKAEALEEMKNGGFGYHTIWKNIETWFLQLDIQAIKKKAGL